MQHVQSDLRVMRPISSAPCGIEGAPVTHEPGFSVNFETMLQAGLRVLSISEARTYTGA